MNRSMLLIASISLLGRPVAFAADAGKETRSISVQGHGKASAVPDQAKLRIQVIQEGPKVDPVAQEVRRKMDAVVKAIRAQGIADKDIQTQMYRVMPKSEWRNGRQNMIGFIASNQVEVIVRDMKKIGAVLTAVTQAGANDVNGPEFGFENPRDLEQKALIAAVQDAKAKAELVAKTTGANLGEPLRIDEGGTIRPGPRPMMMRAMAASAPAEEPIAAGEETIESTITATFALR